jgi:hypothetical protein
MCFLKWLKRIIPLTSETLSYIRNYQSILRKVIKEAKKREIDNHVLLSKNKTKTLWPCVNKEFGNSRNHNHNLVIRDKDELITNPQQISKKFNSFFIETIENLKKVSNFVHSTNILPTNPVYYHNTMFVSPVTDYEVECIINGLKDSFSAGLDDIPETVIKSSVNYIKNH